MGGIIPAAIIGGSTLLGAGLSSSGSKKAAKAGRASIPSAFRPALGSALGSIQQRLGGQLHPLQSMAIQNLGNTFMAGQSGLDSARQTIEALAASGIDPAAINTAQSQLAPYFDFLRGQGLAQTREGEAQGGRFFGSGATGAEGLFNSNFAAQQAAQVLPLALQMTGLRLGAASALPGFLGGQQALANNLFDVGQRTYDDPIMLLASLMQGTPMTYNPVGTQFGQSLGANLGSALGSQGFWDYLSSLRRGSPGIPGANGGGGGGGGAAMGRGGPLG